MTGLHSSGISSRVKTNMTTKILVIGAGASGLMAAHCLIEKGYGVSVIEARDRVGGWIHAMQNNFSRPIETGAEFMHGEQPLTESLISAAGAEAVLLSGKRYQLWDNERKQGLLSSPSSFRGSGRSG